MVSQNPNQQQGGEFLAPTDIDRGQVMNNAADFAVGILRPMYLPATPNVYNPVYSTNQNPGYNTVTPPMNGLVEGF
jgi:hypothetical protein